MHVKRRLARRTGIGTRGILAGLIELQNAPGCLDVEATKLAFQISQLMGGDPVILGAKKKQCHCRRHEKSRALVRTSIISRFLSSKARSITSPGKEHNRDSPIVTSSCLWDRAYSNMLFSGCR